MGVTLPIEALNSGELSPLLAGRGSKDFYKTGLKTSLNMLPLVQGPAVQRSGSYFIREVKTSANRTALIRFEFNVTQAYILEFGDQYMRVFYAHGQALNASTNITAITKANPGVVTANAHGLSNGDRAYIASVLGMVEVDNREFTVAGVTANTFQLQGIDTTAFTTYASGGTVAKIYEIATPYLQADLFDADGTCRLKFAQTLDTLYIAHPSYPTRKLTRTGHTSWTLSTVAFEKGPFSSINNDDTVRIRARGTSTAQYRVGGSVTLFANASIWDANMVGGLFYIEELFLSDMQSATASVLPWATAKTPDAPATNLFSSDGNVYQKVDSGGGGQTGGIAPTHIAGDAWDGVGGDRFKWRYLHSHWSIVQITAFTSATQVTATVVTYLPNGIDQPDIAITNVTNSAGVVRITCAGGHNYSDADYVNTAGITGTVGAAANGNWRISYISPTVFELDGSVFAGAYTGGGTAVRYATWKWANGAFSASKGYPAVVAFDRERLWLFGTTAQPDSGWGSNLGDYENFVGKTAGQVLSTNSISFTLANGEINKIEWAHPETEGIILGTATAEYTLGPTTTTAALGPDNVDAPPRSFYGSRGVQPAKVATTAFFVQRAGRKVRDVGAKAEGSTLAIGPDVTVRAEHLTKTYPIIDMAWVQEPDALLWCIRSDGQLLSFTFHQEQEVFGWGQHQLGGYSDAGRTLAPIVEDVASIPSPDGYSNELWLMVKRYVNGQTRRYIEYLKPRWVDGDPIASAYMVDGGLIYTGAAVSSLSGLFHLIGESVTVLADGKVHPNVTVDSHGAITLNYTASTIAVGLPMLGRVQPMPLEPPTQTGSSSGKKKIVSRVTARLMHSSNIRFGGDFITMERKEFATTESLYDTAVPLQSGDLPVDWPGAWDTAANLCFENDLPVPFGICALYPHVETTEA